MPFYRQDPDSIKGDIAAHMNSGTTIFRGHEDGVNPENEQQDELSLALNTIRGVNHNVALNKMDLVVPDANSVLAQYMEPYTEELDKHPVYESHVRSPKGTGLDMSVHSFVGLRFTGVHPQTHRIGRYHVRAGFVSSGNTDIPTKPFWSPGGLTNDTHSHADISVQRDTTNSVVDMAFRFIPAHAQNSSYHLLRHNCNHFAREVAYELGFGDIGGMHEGIIPSTVYKRMSQKAQEGDTSFFADNYKQTGKYESDYLSDAEKIVNRGDSAEHEKNNLEIFNLNNDLLVGNTVKLLPATRTSFVDNADQMLDQQGLGLFLKINKRGQFGSKNAAHNEAVAVAQDIGRTEDAINGLALEKLMDGTEEEKAGAEQRIRNFSTAAENTVDSTRRLMMMAGRRYWKLGAYSLRISTGFQHLISRVNMLAQSNDIASISSYKQGNSKYSDAEVVSLFSEQESAEEKGIDLLGKNAMLDIVGGGLDVNGATATARAGFILQSIPQYQQMVTNPIKKIRKETTDDKSLPEGTRNEIRLLREETAALSGIKELMTMQPNYMRAIMALYCRQRDSYSTDMIALLLLREMGVFLERMEIKKNWADPDSSLNNDGGLVVGSYNAVLNDKNLKDLDPKKYSIESSKIELSAEHQANSGKEIVMKRNLAYLEAYLTIKDFADAARAANRQVNAANG